MSHCFPLFSLYGNVLPFSQSYDLNIVGTPETLNVINYGQRYISIKQTLKFKKHILLQET